jgi:hypothetical protein
LSDAKNVPAALYQFQKQQFRQRGSPAKKRNQRAGPRLTAQLHSENDDDSGYKPGAAEKRGNAFDGGVSEF